MNPYPRTIVCPTFSMSNDEAAMHCAGVLAKTFGSRLLMLTVVRDKGRSMQRPGTPDYSVRRINLPDGLESSVLEGVNYERFELRGEPVTGIRDFVIEYEADIVVVPNDFDLDGVAALGPRTRRIVESLPCTVMIVKDPACTQAEERFIPGNAVSDKDIEEKFPVSTWLLEHACESTEDFPEPASS